MQIDACRVGGVNENLAILLLAAKFGVPVCPHAGGVGLCEMVQHLAMFDFVAVSGTSTDRWIEYVDHLHEHFTEPVRVERGSIPRALRARRRGPLLDASIAEYRFPDGPAWAAPRCDDLRVDAHHHVWDLSVREQPWMIRRHGRDPRSFDLHDLAEAKRHGIDRTVVVEAAVARRRDRGAFSTSQRPSL